MPPMPCMPTRASALVMTCGFWRSTSSASRTRRIRSGRPRKLGGRLGTANSAPSLGLGWRRLAISLAERGGVIRVVAEILAVQQAQFAGDMLVIAEPEDRGDDDVVAFQGELPFLAHVGGHRRLRPADIDHPVHLRADGVLDLLVEGEPARHQRFAVEPDREAGLR